MTKQPMTASPSSSGGNSWMQYHLAGRRQLRQQRKIPERRRMTNQKVRNLEGAGALELRCGNSKRKLRRNDSGEPATLRGNLPRDEFEITVRNVGKVKNITSVKPSSFYPGTKMLPALWGEPSFVAGCMILLFFRLLKASRYTSSPGKISHLL